MEAPPPIDDALRAELFLERLTRLVGGEDSSPLPLSAAGDTFDAAAHAVNVLAEELRHSSVSRRQLEGVLDAIHDLVVVLDRDGRILCVSGASRSLLGREPTSLVGLSLATLLVDESLVQGLLSELAHAGRVANREIDFLGEGDVLPLVVAGARTDASDAFAVLVARDLNELRRDLTAQAELDTERRLASDLKRAKESAEEASREKSALLASMSHELRTPVASILATAEMLLRDDPETDPARVRTRVERIRRNAQHLVRLVDDLLELGRLESGGFSVELRSACPRGLAASVVDAFAEQARERGLALSLSIEDDVPLYVETDPERFQQALLNVVGNAMKFTTRGAIRVVVRRLGAKLAVDVQDTGLGIDPAEQGRLFVPFSQTRRSIDRRFSGVGLGLALSQRLCRALGGDVELLRSVPDEGSTFRVTILAAPSSPADLVAMPELAGTRVLVVDDEPDLRDAFSSALELAGASTQVAPDGAVALEVAAGAPFDVVLLDLRMPGIGGCEVARRLRARGYAGRLVAVTAAPSPAVRRECDDAGFDFFLPKPFASRLLLDAVRGA